MDTKYQTQNKILTIPNLLSLFRLLLIPLIIWMYTFKKEYFAAGTLLILSGLTDLADGFIARHFNAVSNVGKILDPIADKLTQAAMLFCLVTRFPLMAAPLGVLVLKEIFIGTTGLLMIRKTGEVIGADFHGKVATTLLYIMMILHIFWISIPAGISAATIGICLVSMIFTLFIYGKRNVKVLRGNLSSRKNL
ncbi:MAG TPA: CDP-alcohol phosphatidyltransferase family protein [Candidatus Mediterraneibacter pullicola]|uniref:CDP-diacylglycerol--glycerol-3-phosphate 3-phosphatidyltransferase n=1 Tax=Candidatus Mediterraneibacter pullicola TaxID=2838682 RepID=A0A9D2H9T7_9FIRM|nr:CDP-alcohol phosphatidyltransferase family protein [Candidatus Mediterraneibacter pullicola]